jgi:hypothetical protein
MTAGTYTGKNKSSGKSKRKSQSLAGARVRGREADFSTALLAKSASSFGRNDDSLVCVEETCNGKSNSKSKCGGSSLRSE